MAKRSRSAPGFDSLAPIASAVVEFPPTMTTARTRLIQFNLISDIGPLRGRRLLEAFGGIEPLVRATSRELCEVPGIGPMLAERIVAAWRDEASVARELDRVERAGACLLTQEEAGYPAALRTIIDPPLAIYMKGAVTESDRVAVALVGARRASRYGLQCAGQLAYELALRGVTVVSGLARGIDAAAHEGALRADGRTLAVLGSGLSRLYPEEHRVLADRIAAHGAVLSEFPMEMAPLAHNFPRRNRLISGLSLGVVVVEAAQRSGSLITADCALEQGREVFAVPGPMTAVTSHGTHRLLKQGARLVTSVDDILEELRLHPQPAAPPEASGQRILACLHHRDATSIDAVAARSGLPIAEVSAILLQLELQGLVNQRPGKRFVRSP